MFYPKLSFMKLKSSMQQSFKVGCTINLDTHFKFHRTKFYRVARVQVSVNCFGVRFSVMSHFMFF